MFKNTKLSMRYGYQGCKELCVLTQERWLTITNTVDGEQQALALQPFEAEQLIALLQASLKQYDGKPQSINVNMSGTLSGLDYDEIAKKLMENVRVHIKSNL